MNAIAADVKPVFQTRMTREEAGNCFEACIASVLEVPLSDVPDFGARVLDARPDWPQLVREHAARGEALPWPEGADEGYEAAMMQWLASLGLTYWEYDVPEQATRDQILWMVRDGYWIASTQVHPSFRHATVWKGDRLVHNPTPGWPVGPDGVPALGELRCATLFGALDPPLVARALSSYFAGESRIRTAT